MSENLLVKYSEFFGDDGGFAKVEADFDALEVSMVAKAKRFKKELNDALGASNVGLIGDKEKEIADLRAYATELKKLRAEITKEEVASEKAKQARLQTTKKEIEAERELDRAIQQENNTKKSAIQLTETERRAKEASTKTTMLQKGAYSLLSAELRKLFTESADLASEMYKLTEAGKRATPEYKKLENQFDLVASKTKRLDGALKTIDSSLGRNQRNVGNYTSGYNGLGNSINQLSRELPAFTYSAQTGILALSNNIPILTDEIGKLQKANVELASQGKPTVSVLKQILGAVFSLQTAMGLGILLATLYAKEIANWGKALFETNSALKANEMALNDVYEAKKRYNASTAEGAKQTEKDITNYVILNKIISDKSKTDKERLYNAQKLIDLYPGYLENYSKEEILAYRNGKANGALSESLKQLTADITERNLADEQSNQASKTFSNIEDLRAEIKLREELNKQRSVSKNYASQEISKQRLKEHADLINSSEEFIAKYGNISVTELVYFSKAEIDGLKVRLNSLVDEYNIERNEINNKIKKTSLLDFKPDKKEVLKNQVDSVDSVDYLASDYALQKQLLENTISTNEEIFNSDKYTIDRRLDAQKNLVTQSLALSTLNKRESLRVLEDKYLAEKNETIKDSDGKIIANKYTAKGLKELEYQYQLDIKQIKETFRKDEEEANKKAEDLGTMFKLEAQVAYFERQRKELSKTTDEWELYNIQISKARFWLEQLTTKPVNDFLADQLETSRQELVEFKDYVKDVQTVLSGRNFKDLSKREQAKVVKQVENLERERADIKAKYDNQEIENQIKHIDKQLETETYGTQKYFDLMTKRNKLVLQQQEALASKLLDKGKDANKKMLEDFDMLIKAILDRLIMLSNKRQEQNQKDIENNKKAIDTQEARAQAGLTNTLAFEQKALAEREANQLREQKKEERLQKIKALYTSYTNYANKDDGKGEAILKALRDFSILEAITASFGDGGIVDGETIAKKNRGVMVGNSHKSKSKGIPILAEGGEGIFSRGEMQNLGKGNFYKMKELANSGKIDSNFFAGQKENFFKTVVIPKGDDAVVLGLKDLKTAIDNKPVIDWNLAEHTEQIFEIIKTTSKKNKVIRDHYKIQKPPL